MSSPHSHLKDNFAITRIVTVLTGLALLSEIWAFLAKPTYWQSASIIIIATIIALILLLLIKRSFMVYYLLSTFAVITAWRLAALAHFYLTAWIFTAVMLLKLVNYITLAVLSIQSARQGNQMRHQITSYEWQLLFIRLFIGFDLIPHFCEKLLASSAIRNLDVQDFVQLHVPHAFAMVIISGLIEFGGALSISCGFMTRLGAICLSIYLMVATVLGGHFHDSFIWASKGGGWEYPVFWTALILSFACFGAGDISIDRWLKDHYQLPMWVRWLMGGRPGKLHA